jgi:hypothetical protein
MQSEEAIRQLEDRHLPLEKVEEIFLTFRDNMQVVGQVAMNLSLRTSVYAPEKSAHPLMGKLLTALAEVEDMGSRWAVAKNPHTPVEVLTKLADDEVNLVRALVAANPNTPPALLQRLFNDEKIVRDGLSGNPATPAKLLNTLSDDTDRMVRIRLCENPATPEKTLAKLCDDPDPSVAKAAQVNLQKRRSAS